MRKTLERRGTHSAQHKDKRVGQARVGLPGALPGWPHLRWTEPSSRHHQCRRTQPRCPTSWRELKCCGQRTHLWWSGQAVASPMHPLTQAPETRNNGTYSRAVQPLLSCYASIAMVSLVMCGTTFDAACVVCEPPSHPDGCSPEPNREPARPALRPLRANVASSAAISQHLPFFSAVGILFLTHDKTLRLSTRRRRR